MARHATAWALAALSLVPAIACFLPGRLPGIDQLDALLPATLLLAVLSISLDWRARSSLIAVTALVITGVLAARELTSPAAPVGGRSMVVITHNVARRNQDPAGTAAALISANADVLFLQETNGTFAPYLAQLRRRYPYGNTCRRGCSLAILSRWPLTRVRWRFHRPDGHAFGPGLLATSIALPWGGSASLATVHLSRAAGGADRERHRDALAAAVQQAGPASLVLAGDFNLSPWGTSMRQLERGLGPMSRVTRALFTYPAGWPWPMPVVPIDHVFIGPAWRVAAVQRLPATGSDHYPVRVNLLWHQPSL